MLLSKLIADFINWNSSFRSERTSEHYVRNLNRFLSYVGDVEIESLKAHNLVMWGKTWHQIQSVQRLFNWASLEANLINQSPFRSVSKPCPGQRNRIIDRGTLARIIMSSGRDFRNYLFALKETISRPQELRAATWENVYWPSKPVHMEESLTQGLAMFVFQEYKSRRRRSDPNAPRVIPITPALGRLLARLARQGTQEERFVFLRSDGRPWTNNAVRLRMRRVRNKLRIGRDTRGENIVAYTIRHTLATWAAARGVRDRTLADIMGHTSTRTTGRYQHLQVEHLAEALRSIHERRKRAS